MGETPDLSFTIHAVIAGVGRDAEGTILVDGERVRYSAPSSMGGKGVGASPETLLISAVTACYSLTLLHHLRKHRLPLVELAIRTQGIVNGHPRHHRFARIIVNPTIRGGDPARDDEYGSAASEARDHCFIGQTVAAGGVAYEVGAVEVAPASQVAQEQPA